MQSYLSHLISKKAIQRGSNEFRTSNYERKRYHESYNSSHSNEKIVYFISNLEPI